MGLRSWRKRSASASARCWSIERVGVDGRGGFEDWMGSEDSEDFGGDDEVVGVLLLWKSFSRELVDFVKEMRCHGMTVSTN